MSEHIPIPRAAVDRLNTLLRVRDMADAEARGMMAGLALALGLEAEQVAGVDDGDDPALLLRSEDDAPAAA